MKQRFILCLLLCAFAIVLFVECSVGLISWTFKFSTLCTIIAAIFALHKWSESIAVKRIELLRSLMDDFYRNGHKETFYKFVERGCDEYYIKGELKFKNEDIECQIDSLLRFFNHILYLNRESGIISDKEIQWFGYYLERISSDQQINFYLEELSEYCYQNKATNPFKWLILFRNEWKKNHPLLSVDSEEDFSCEKIGVSAFDLNVRKLQKSLIKDKLKLNTRQSILSRIVKINKLIALDGFSPKLSSEELDKMTKAVVAVIDMYPRKNVKNSLKAAFRKYIEAVTDQKPNVNKGGMHEEFN